MGSVLLVVSKKKVPPKASQQTHAVTKPSQVKLKAPMPSKENKLISAPGCTSMPHKDVPANTHNKSIRTEGIHKFVSDDNTKLFEVMDVTVGTQPQQH